MILHFLYKISDLNPHQLRFDKPPGPPGFNKICLSPVAEALVANIRMRGIENVLSPGLLWSIGTSSLEPFVISLIRNSTDKQSYIPGRGYWVRRSLPISVWTRHWSSVVSEIRSRRPTLSTPWLPRGGRSDLWFLRTSFFECLMKAWWWVWWLRSRIRGERFIR